MIAGATSADIPDTLVLRDGGSFAATSITVTGQLIFEGSNGNFAAFQGSASTGNYTAILPPDTGHNGFVLQTDGGVPTATLTWVAPGGDGGGITSINGAIAATQTLITSSAGILFNVNPTSSSNNTIQIPYAGNLPNNSSGVGLITGADYYNFSHTSAVVSGTSCNDPSTLVLRDANGNFSASTITLMNTFSLINYVNGVGCQPGVGFIFAPTNNNTLMGTNAGNNNTLSGASNTAFGFSALSGITTGLQNTVIGANSGTGLSTGFYNTIVGQGSGNALTTGSTSPFVTGAVNNVIIGEGAATSLNAADNVVIGQGAATSLNTIFSVIIGSGAATTITAGNSNVIIGAVAGPTNTATAGGSNVVIGSEAGQFINSNNNIVIGASAGSAVTNGGGAIVIGTGLAGGNTGTFIGGLVSGTADEVEWNPATGQLFYNTASSKRYKENIKDIVHLSENIYKLRPVVFNYINDTAKQPAYGLISEEVVTIYPEIVGYDENGLANRVRYKYLPILMLNEQQKDHARIDQLEQQIVELKEKLKLLLMAQAA